MPSRHSQIAESTRWGAQSSAQTRDRVDQVRPDLPGREDLLQVTMEFEPLLPNGSVGSSTISVSEPEDLTTIWAISSSRWMRITGRGVDQRSRRRGNPYVGRGPRLRAGKIWRIRGLRHAGETPSKPWGCRSRRCPRRTWRSSASRSSCRDPPASSLGRASRDPISSRLCVGSKERSIRLTNPRSRLRRAMVRRSVRLGFEGPLRAATSRRGFVNFHPHFESMFAPELNGGSTLRTSMGEARRASEFQREWTSEWGDIRYDADEIIDLGHRVMVLGRLEAKGLRSGAAVD